MPVALVEFDDEINFPPARCRYGLLNLLYVANWTATETVVVHVLEALPGDVGPYYGLPAVPLPSEVETHARYAVAGGDPDATRRTTS
jgi:hypothetical protein